MARGTKSGGRQKGSPNKVTKDTRKKFNELLDMFTVDQMYKDLLLMKPIDRMNIIAGLAEYIVPKLARTELTADVNIKTISDTTIFSVKPKK